MLDGRASLSFIHFLCEQHPVVFVNQLYQIDSFGQIAYIVEGSLCVFKGFDFLANEIEDCHITHDICIVLDSKLLNYRIGIYRQIGLVGTRLLSLQSEAAQGKKEECEYQLFHDKGK